MLRNKKIIILSHCILNQNSVVKPLARSKGAYSAVLKLILDNNIGIVQLPCPELLFLGATRPPMSKKQYNTTEYRAFCNSLLQTAMFQIKEYLSNNYTIIGIIGIEESPTCGIRNNPGILMEEFLSLLKDEKIELPTFQIPTGYLEGKNNQSFLSLLEGFVYNT